MGGWGSGPDGKYSKESLRKLESGPKSAGNHARPLQFFCYRRPSFYYRRLDDSEDSEDPRQFLYYRRPSAFITASVAPREVQKAKILTRMCLAQQIFASF